MKGYHVTDNRCFDIVHTLLEGVLAAVGMYPPSFVYDPLPYHNFSNLNVWALSCLGRNDIAFIWDVQIL